MKKLLSFVFLITATALFSQVDLVSDLKLCLPFQGNASDLSGNGNNGSVSNATLTTDRFGAANSAYQFHSSSNSFISIATFSALAPTNELTISMWAKSDATTSNCLFILNPDSASDRCVGCAQYLYNANTLMYWDYGNILSGGRMISSPIAADNSNWHHYSYILSQAGNIKQAYMDGNPQAGGAYALSCINKNLPLYIGGGYSNGTQASIAWNGKIDEVSVYNRALNAGEVSALYNSVSVCSARTATTVGLNELKDAQTILIYPTISDDGIFHVSHKFDSQSRIDVYNLDGRLIKTDVMETAGTENKVDIGFAEKGIFLLKVNTGGNVFTQKLIRN